MTPGVMEYRYSDGSAVPVCVMFPGEGGWTNPSPVLRADRTRLQAVKAVFQQERANGMNVLMRAGIELNVTRCGCVVKKGASAFQAVCEENGRNSTTTYTTTYYRARSLLERFADVIASWTGVWSSRRDASGGASEEEVESSETSSSPRILGTTLSDANKAKSHPSALGFTPFDPETGAGFPPHPPALGGGVASRKMEHMFGIEEASQLVRQKRQAEALFKPHEDQAFSSATTPTRTGRGAPMINPFKLRTVFRDDSEAKRRLQLAEGDIMSRAECENAAAAVEGYRPLALSMPPFTANQVQNLFIHLDPEGGGAMALGVWNKRALYQKTFFVDGETRPLKPPAGALGRNGPAPPGMYLRRQSEVSKSNFLCQLMSMPSSCTSSPLCCVSHATKIRLRLCGNTGRGTSMRCSMHDSRSRCGVVSWGACGYDDII